jgi:hypothetical protein
MAALTRYYAAQRVASLRSQSHEAIALGWADQATLEAMYAELTAWGERPDAVLIAPVCQTIGWVAGGTPEP